MKKIISVAMLGTFALSSVAVPFAAEGKSIWSIFTTSKTAVAEKQIPALLDVDKIMPQWGWITLDEFPGDPKVSCELPELEFKDRNDSIYLAQIVLGNMGFYPERLITGYFGRLTKKAVQSYQKEHGFAPNGKVNGDTRVALNEYIRANFSECSVSIQNLSPVITFVKGPEILNTNEIGTWNIQAYDPDGSYLEYFVDWGDGLKVAPSAKQDTVLAPRQDVSFTHAYASAGVYVIEFLVRDSKGGEARKSTTVNVGGVSVNRPPQIIEIPATPKTVEVNQKISLSFRGYDPDGDALSWTFSFGDEREPISLMCFDSNCWDVNFTVSWPKSGNYTAVVTASDGKSAATYSFNIQVVEIKSANKPPVITGVGGPTYLKVNEVGTWRIQAYDPDGNYLMYFIDWGDGFYPMSYSKELNKNILNQNTTFTHSYAQSGSYIVAFVVRDENGGETRSTITVDTYAPSVFDTNTNARVAL